MAQRRRKAFNAAPSRRHSIQVVPKPPVRLGHLALHVQVFQPTANALCCAQLPIDHGVYPSSMQAPAVLQLPRSRSLHANRIAPLDVNVSIALARRHAEQPSQLCSRCAEVLLRDVASSTSEKRPLSTAHQQL
eukprot:TRINITY_DN6471_c0_g1_i1.p3 TRINITY_DN6471_c0_g1~~TRINITY_DN6471_c0_g1_i1.p3  ORF type:complete len:133 (-),score=3.10 TRINITY_DN6471_c0_g1_i1:321-719(-)